ncbi:hypothetical protein [Streptomyces monashensis]|nr:hypothetical protein [Streptomyces monashensis]
MASATFSEAVAVWESAEWDVVLLVADRALVGAGVQAVGFGELVSDYPARRPVCSTTGFAKAMRRKVSARSERYVDDLKTVDGRIAPHTGSRSKMYSLEVDGAVVTDVRNWQGLSGAGVFCNGVLVAMATLVDPQWDRGILVRPLSHLLADKSFAAAVSAHTGMAPRLQPADLKGLLDDIPSPTLSSSHLLDPRAQVVGLTGMTDLIGQIEQWCNGPGQVDVAAVTGLGGTGKSRLVVELLSRLTARHDNSRPWSGGFLSETPPHTDYGMLASSSYPLLIAVDLAEAHIPQIRDLARALAVPHDGACVRVLLLARGHDGWWPALSRYLRAQQAGAARETFMLTPDDALEGHGPENIYVEAKAAFARRIRLLQQAGHADSTWSDTVVADAPRRYGDGIEHTLRQPVIYHHVAALADVLARANPDFARKDHPMEVLLANEENYLRRIAEARLGTGAVDMKLLHTLVSAQLLAGATTARDGKAAIRAGFDVHHHGYGATAPPDPERLAALDDVLAAAYPAVDGAHWGAIGAPLAAAWLTEAGTSNGGEFVEHFLQHDVLAPEQRRRTLSTVIRAAQEQPALADAAHRAVASDPERLLPLAAQTITTELGPDQAQQWLADLEHSITDRAAQPDVDRDVYEWAAAFLGEVQAQVATGAEEMDEFIDVLLHEDTADEEDDEAESEPDTDAPERPADLPLIRTRVSVPIRIVITVLAVGHLGLVTATLIIALNSDSMRGVGWARWCFLAGVPSAHLAIATAYGSRPPVRRVPIFWIAPLFIIVWTTAFAVMAHLPLPLPWALWPLVFGIGLVALAFAWRMWVGRFPAAEPPTV